MHANTFALGAKRVTSGSSTGSASVSPWRLRQLGCGLKSTVKPCALATLCRASSASAVEVKCGEWWVARGSDLGTKPAASSFCPA